jgi:2'-5' RNA ligase
MAVRPGISKYFIALVPPSPALEQAQQWKEYFKIEFNAKAALNSPPHITLHMPFEWKSAKENVLMEKLDMFAQAQKPFTVELKNFGAFAPRVIFIQVLESIELKTLQSTLTRFCKTGLNLFNANRLDQPYHPHLTVAFRDLKKAVFPKAWDFVKDIPFQQQFLVENLVLLKHDGKQWKARAQFPLAVSAR